MDPEASNYKSHYVRSDSAACPYDLYEVDRGIYRDATTRRDHYQVIRLSGSNRLPKRNCYCDHDDHPRPETLYRPHSDRG